jgi:carboxymethylenebutenolidase
VCFEVDSAPPIPVISGAAVAHRDLVLESDDGARLAAFAATSDGEEKAGVVILPDVRGLYGRPGEGADGSPGPAQRAGEIGAPILGLMGGADQAITAEDVAAFEAALEAPGVEHELVTYPGAPHSFFDRKQDEFAEASDDAWRRVLEFVEGHT